MLVRRSKWTLIFAKSEVYHLRIRVLRNYRKSEIFFYYFGVSFQGDTRTEKFESAVLLQLLSTINAFVYNFQRSKQMILKNLLSKAA